MADFNKINDHPEKQIIITKLASGETPKAVSAYLKDKFDKPDEGHLRLSAALLQEFIDKYANHHGYIQRVIKDDLDSKLDKKIAQSLLDNKTWKEKLKETANETVDFHQSIKNVMRIIEARAEQIYDLIQSNPESTKPDYVFTKYLEMYMMAIEKGDKVINARPDVRIEHTYTVQMVEQQSYAFQEAIRRVLERMSPEFSSMFLDFLNDELAKMNPRDIGPAPPTKTELAHDKESVTKLIEGVKAIDKTLEDIDVSS